MQCTARAQVTRHPTSPTFPSDKNLTPAAARIIDDESRAAQLSKRFREFELEFGMEELVAMACSSGACAAVVQALTRHVKLCVEQGCAAAVCHSAWQRLQDFKEVMQLLRQAVVEGESMAMETALKSLLQQVPSFSSFLSHIPSFHMLCIFTFLTSNLTIASYLTTMLYTFIFVVESSNAASHQHSNLQRIAARHEFWNSKLRQLDQQRHVVHQNTVNSIQVAQQSFSPEVLLATHHNKCSSELLHMQRKVNGEKACCLTTILAFFRSI